MSKNIKTLKEYKNHSIAIHLVGGVSMNGYKLTSVSRDEIHFGGNNYDIKEVAYATNYLGKVIYGKKPAAKKKTTLISCFCKVLRIEPKNSIAFDSKLTEIGDNHIVAGGSKYCLDELESIELGKENVLFRPIDIFLNDINEYISLLGIGETIDFFAEVNSSLLLEKNIDILPAFKVEATSSGKPSSLDFATEFCEKIAAIGPGSFISEETMGGIIKRLPEVISNEMEKMDAEELAEVILELASALKKKHVLFYIEMIKQSSPDSETTELEKFLSKLGSYAEDNEFFAELYLKECPSK